VEKRRSLRLREAKGVSYNFRFAARSRNPLG
jgi:hypothetical protein